LVKSQGDFVIFVWLFVIFVVSSPPRAIAQPAVTGSVSNVTRVESWSYFQPRIDILALTAEPVGEPDYTFVGDRAELGVRVAGKTFDLAGAFNYVRLENLPTRAIGPGGFGAGAFYFAATGVRYSYQLYLGELTVRVKSADRRRSLTVGRMPYTRLRDAAAAPGGEAGDGLARLTRDRLDGRLVGNFEWSLYQRRFDGARLDVDSGRWQFTAAAFMPTQGGFEESTNLTMTKVQVGTLSATRMAAGAETQVFGHLYRDRRAGPSAVVDNSFSADRPVDITLATVGGSHARVVKTVGGVVDVVAWGAMQAGAWYGTPHRAASLALEAGHRWTRVPARPWLRAGAWWASGDGDGRDGRHGTFFQLLPSSRHYALSAAYAHMNLRDLFVQALVEPRRLRARIDVHRLSLASGRDLWYQGSGATASKDRYLGFAGRDAGGHRPLGTVLEGTIDVPIRTYWSVNAYAGTMWPGAAVRRMFTEKRLTVWALENVIRF
jgi:hypothetical protein